MTIQLVREEAMLAWLQSDEVVTADGEVISWSNPDHPGYAYPEIAGYLLSLLSQAGEETIVVRDRIAARLARDLSADGGVGRGGVDYVFDSAMALSGLMAHQKTGGVLPDPSVPARLYEFIVGHLEARNAVGGVPPVDQRHWSVSYGCHQLKTILAICAYDGSRLQPRSQALIETLLRDLLPLQEGGRFRVNVDSPLTYAHAACYAVEGLLTVEGRGIASVRPVIEACADWLAAVQLDDGGTPSGHDGEGPLGEAHTDCTAQSIRIWTCVDPERYSGSIARGTDFLRAMTSGGGLRYRPGSDDINTWATIFGVQAFEWAKGRGEGLWIV